MPSYPMNIGPQGIEQDRNVVDAGFNGNFHVETHPATALMPTVPYNKPSPLVNEVNESSDTAKPPMPPSAHDIVVRSS